MEKKKSMKPKLPIMMCVALTVFIMMTVMLPCLVMAAVKATYTTTLETGPVNHHEAQTYTMDCATNEFKNAGTGEVLCYDLNGSPFLYPGDTVRFIPQPGDDHACKGCLFGPDNPSGHYTAKTFACKDDGKVHVEVTEANAWGEPNEFSGENLYINEIKIVGDELVKLQSWGGGDYTGIPPRDNFPGAAYRAFNLDFVYIPAWCKVNTELWYSHNESHIMTEEESATAAFYDNDPDTTVIWAVDARANSSAGENWEDYPVGLTLRRPYIEGFCFSGFGSGSPDEYSGKFSTTYGYRASDTWHGNYWEGWPDNIVEFVPFLDGWNGKDTGYCAHGSYDQGIYIRLVYGPNRTLTLDACGGTIDGYPTRIYEAANNRQYWDEDLRNGVVDAQYAAGEKYIPVREGYVFDGWYEDPEYTTKVISFKETLNKYSTNSYDSRERHVCRMYAKWLKVSSVTLADQTKDWTGSPVTISEAEVTGTTGTVTYRYYSDADCTQEISPDKVIEIGTYYVKAFAEADENCTAAESEAAVLTVSAVSIERASVGGVSLSYGYSGKAYVPKLTVKVNEKTLIQDTDFTAVYADNKDPGTATITITGIGHYTGTRIKKFEIVDCVSSLVSGKTYQIIPKNNSATAVCSFSGRMVNNTKVYITDRSSSEAMKFKAVKNSDGSWKFINAKCELALAVQQNSSVAGKGLVLYDQTTRPAQNWKLARKSDNSFAITNAVSGLYIAMSDMSAPKGTTLSIMENSGRGNQRFYIVETSAVSAPFDGTYAVKASKNKAYGLNIASSSKTDGANVNLYKYSNINAKKFKAIYSGGGYYRLVNVNSGLCLTVKGNTKTNGANVIQSKWAAQSGQRWKITKNSDGTVTLKNVLGTVLHLNGNKTANGTNVVAKNASTTGAQKWYLE